VGDGEAELDGDAELDGEAELEGDAELVVYELPLAESVT
jgi:hypothetical protein